MQVNLRLLYLYLFSLVGLLIIVFGSIQLVNLGLKTFIFTEADKYSVYAEPFSTPEADTRMQEEITRQRQRELSNSVAMVSIGLPLYLYHWRTIQKENKRKEDKT